MDNVVSNHLVKHQLDSFNNNIDWELRAVIRNESSIRLTYPSGYLLLIKLSVVVSNQLYGKDVHKMYDHRHLFLSMPQRDSYNNIMIAYVIAILLLQRDGIIKISTSPTAPTVTPELINRLGSRWNTMLKRQ